MSGIYLCGFMGCGKSHIGRMLAAAMGRTFADLDRVITEGEQMSIPTIFEKYGEPYFRKLEARYIRELSDGYIVATGGGALINDETAEYAREAGLSVYINCAFDICYRRIRGDVNRPLVMQNTYEQLKALYDKRDAIYRKNSMCMVNGSTRDFIITGEIIKLAEFYEKYGRM